MSTTHSRFIAAAIAGAGILAAVAAGGAPAQPKSGEFDQVETVTTPRLSLKSTDHVVFKGLRYTLDSTDTSSYTPYVDVVDGQSYYRYLPSQHTAFRVALKEKQVSPLDELKQQTDAKLLGTTKTGETTVNGFDCNIFTRDISGGKVTLYQSKDQRFPYIVKTVLSISSAGVTQSNSIENVKLDVPVADDTFTLPKGTKIIEQQPGGGIGPAQGGSGGSTAGGSGAAPSSAAAGS